MLKKYKEPKYDKETERLSKLTSKLEKETSSKNSWEKKNSIRNSLKGGGWLGGSVS